MRSMRRNITGVVSGRDFNTLPHASLPRSRTFISYVGTTIYIGVSHVGVTANTLMNDLSTMGFDPVTTVNLDGGGSTKMQARDSQGFWRIAGSGEEREVPSMVVVRNEWM